MSGVEHRLDQLYRRASPDDSMMDALDVFVEETHGVDVRELIEVRRAPGADDLLATPLVVSVPHAGTLIPSRFADRFPRTDDTLVEIDLFSHLLYEQLPGTAVICRAAPFFLDMNRGRTGADEPHVPRHLHNPPHEYYTVDDELILEHPYSEDEVAEILRLYDLYHDVLDLLIEECRRRHGRVLLLDGHSMTSVGLGRVHDEGEERDNVVVGNLGRSSANDAVIDAFVNALREGFAPSGLEISVAENVPYSGGHIIRKHHDPDGEVHALQVEVSMATYMYESDAHPIRRHTIKQHRLDIVRRVLNDAVGAALAG